MAAFFSVQNVRLYYKRKERDEESQGKMQESGQFEIDGALGEANIITTLPFLSGDNIVNVRSTNRTQTEIINLIAVVSPPNRQPQ